MTTQDQGDFRQTPAQTHRELIGELAAVNADARDFRAEMREFTAEMRELMAEMREFRAEMLEFKSETKRELSELRRLAESRDQRSRRNGVLLEELQGQVQQIAEVLVSFRDEMRAYREEQATQMKRLESLLRASFSQLDIRVSKLEEKLCK